ncbi:MAG TPA: hypothetical protein VH141_24515 [Pseudonocardia sp.]|nr:hypothetical protein [Pseudonocardia sp.]
MSPRTPGLARHASRQAAERARVRSRRLIIALVAVLAVGGASVAVAMFISSRRPAVDPTSAQGADRTAAAPPATAAAPPADPNAPGTAPPPGSGPAEAAPPAAGAVPPAAGTGSSPGAPVPGESVPTAKATKPVAKPGSSAAAAKPGSSTSAKAGASTSAKAGSSASAKAGESSSRASGSAPSRAEAAKPAGRQIPVELTGYSFFDNTPAGSAEVSNPILHKRAGGRGSYADPITVAVPSDSKFDPGTRFYLPSVRRYAIVEDSGASSTSGNHLDLWVDGEGGSESAVEACMDQVTGDTTAEVSPPPGRPVILGPIFDGSCHLPKG